MVFFIKYFLFIGASLWLVCLSIIEKLWIYNLFRLPVDKVFTYSFTLKWGLSTMYYIWIIYSNSAILKRWAYDLFRNWIPCLFTNSTKTGLDIERRFPRSVRSRLPSESHSEYKFRNTALKGAFQETSAGWQRRVHPPGITERRVFLDRKFALIPSVMCARNASHTSNLF